MALQMSWQPSLLSHKRKTGPPLGLRNLGNSCYLNSVLQCLTYTPPLANFCLNNLHSSLCDSCVDAERKRDCPFCILEKRIVRSLRGDLVQDAPAKIQSCLRLFAEHFRSGRQEDAHEFLRYVIDACHNTCLRLKKLRHHQRKGADVANGKCNSNGISSGSSIVKEIFGGALQSQVRCLSCGAESNKVDEIMDISLEVLYSNSLKESLHKFFQPEILDGNNKYKCEKCKKLVAARKQMSIFQAPNILVVQLKRFEGIYGGKIDKTVQFEETLMLSSFMCKASQDLSPEYRLFATIVHAGCSPDSGHYFAYIKDAMGRWYCCNDSYVTLATMEEVLSEKVYILFFSRTKQRPSSVNSSSTFVANGVASHSCNGKEAQKSQGPALSSKPPLKPSVEESSWKAVSITSKATKVPSGPRMKFSISGSVVSKRIPAINNGNADIQKNQLVEDMDTKETVDTHKGEKVKAKSAVTDNSNKENGVIIAGNERRKDLVSHGDNCNKENGVINAGTENRKDMLVKNHKAYKVDEISHDKSQVVVSANGNGKIRVLDSVESCKKEINGIVKSDINGTGPSHFGYCNGSDHNADFSGSKRRLQENSCKLLTRDAQSQKKVEELKEVLKHEASSVLRTCGWSDEVYSFMRMKKRICTREAASLDSSNLKKKLVADAKMAFLSKIPESLKEDLIEHLRTFSKEAR